jgi:hypothetical protein
MPRNRAAQTQGTYSEGYVPTSYSDYIPDDYVDTYNVNSEVMPAPVDILCATIQPPVDGLEKLAPISHNVPTYDMTLAVFRTDSKRSIRRKLPIFKHDRPGKTASDIGIDEKLLNVMRT